MYNISTYMQAILFYLLFIILYIYIYLFIFNILFLHYHIEWLAQFFSVKYIDVSW